MFGASFRQSTREFISVGRPSVHSPPKDTRHTQQTENTVQEKISLCCIAVSLFFFLKYYLARGKSARGTICKQHFMMGWCVSCSHGYHLGLRVCVLVCVCVGVWGALTAIIDVRGDVDGRVVVISQTFKGRVLFKVRSNPVFPSLRLICIQLRGKKKKNQDADKNADRKVYNIIQSLFILFLLKHHHAAWNSPWVYLKAQSDCTSSSTSVWCDNVIAAHFRTLPAHLREKKKQKTQHYRRYA